MNAIQIAKTSPYRILTTCKLFFPLETNKGQATVEPSPAFLIMLLLLPQLNLGQEDLGLNIGWLYDLG